MKRIIAFSVLSLFVSACIDSYTVKAKLVKPAKKQDILEAIVSVVQENGYVVEMANSKIGIVNTDWKENRTLLGLERTRLAFSYNENENIIRMTPTIQLETDDGLWTNISIKQGDETLNKILRQIAAKINNQATIIWLKTD